MTLTLSDLHKSQAQVRSKIVRLQFKEGGEARAASEQLRSLGLEKHSGVTHLAEETVSSNRGSAIRQRHGMVPVRSLSQLKSGATYEEEKAVSKSKTVVVSLRKKHTFVCVVFPLTVDTRNERHFSDTQVASLMGKQGKVVCSPMYSA